MVKITQEILEAGRSTMGGFSLRQANCFGIEAKSWPIEDDGKQVVDWSSLVVGNEFPEQSVNRFLKLKDVHLAGGVQDE